MTTTTAPSPTPTPRPSPGPIDPIGTDLARTLRALKLSGLKDTLPERLALARQHDMGHAAFLELLLMDEVTRREGRSATLRAAKPLITPSGRWLMHQSMRAIVSRCDGRGCNVAVDASAKLIGSPAMVPLCRVSTRRQYSMPDTAFFAPVSASSAAAVAANEQTPSPHA